jgi:acetyltransferase-like isoleucine patch superfamily enzyme
MIPTREERAIPKEHVREAIHGRASAGRLYKEFFAGSVSLLLYESVTVLCGPCPGALGLFLRRSFYPSLFQRVGAGAVWGRNIALRHPGRIRIGDRVAIDDECLLDAKGSGEAGLEIGDDVLIARGTILQAKGTGIKIGDRCVIGSQCQLASVGGIRLGRSVMISGQCYVGGGRYRTDDPHTAIMDQQLYSKGEVVIDDDVWIGAGVIVQDGVRVGRGSVIGAGAVLREDVPESTVVVPQQRLVMLPRNKD